MREHSAIRIFHGPLASYFAKFLAEKHALGFRYNIQSKVLQVLDRFLQETGITDAALPRTVVEAWTAKRDLEQVATQEHRVCVTRELTRFLQRQGIDAYVPPQRAGRRQPKSFSPYIFTITELQSLLAAVEQIPSHPYCPNRNEVVPLIFQILVQCGPRLGEVLSLRWRNVDVERGILSFLDAKGHQDRLVPLSPGLTERVQQYAALKNRAAFPDSIAFPAPDGEAYSRVRIYALFRKALRGAGISHGGRGRGPRLHDLRHTFAVHKLMDWYRKGVNIDAALPILATYMGHRSIEGTQQYLRLTAELYPDLIHALDSRYGNLLPGKEQP